VAAQRGHEPFHCTQKNPKPQEKGSGSASGERGGTKRPARDEGEKKRRLAVLKGRRSTAAIEARQIDKALLMGGGKKRDPVGESTASNRQKGDTTVLG